MELDPAFCAWAAMAGVVAVYAHGSRVRGKARPDSDLDLAILLGSRLDWRAEEQLCLEAERRLPSEFRLDIRILNEAPPAFQFRVVRERCLLFESDRSARVRFEAGVFAAYHDQQYYRDLYDAALHDRIREGRFGRRPAIYRPPA